MEAKPRALAQSDGLPTTLAAYGAELLASFVVEHTIPVVQPARKADPMEFCGLVRTAIAAVAEESCRALRRDASQRRAAGGVQRVHRAGGDAAQLGLHLGPAGLNRVQIRRVSGQVVVGEARGVEQRPDARPPPRSRLPQRPPVRGYAAPSNMIQPCLLYHLTWMHPPRPDVVLRWSAWRRRHQQRARRAHWHRRLRSIPRSRKLRL